MPINFDPLRDAIRREVMSGIIQATELVRAEAVRLVLQTRKSGRLYGKHKASAPGEPWASDTGFGVSQIKSHYDKQALTGSVSIDTDYGLHLELGTEKMEPRPVLRPALANKGQQVSQIINAAVARGIKASGQ